MINEIIQFMISVLSDVDNFVESINLSKYSVVNLNNIYTNIELNQKIDNPKTVKSNLIVPAKISSSQSGSLPSNQKNTEYFK